MLIKRAEREIEHGAPELELKLAEGEAAAGTFEGYASLHGVLDRGGDIVEKGAYRTTLADWKRKKSLPSMLWQHDTREPIGVWTEIVEDHKGLYVKGELILDGPQAAKAYALLKRGAIKGLSIGFVSVKDEIDRSTGARRLKQIDLWEISIVTMPMLPGAGVTAVKGGGGAFDPPLWERAFRDEGLSCREAKLATSVARKMFLRDGGKTEPASRDEAADALMAIRRGIEALRV